MSAKHPIIAVTGSSGAGTSTSTNAFRSMFHQLGYKAAVVEGDSFHRYTRPEMDVAIRKAREQGRHISYFGPEANDFGLLESFFQEYGQSGTGQYRRYLHSFDEAVPFNQMPGTFTPWQDLPGETDLLFYEGLHGGVVTGEHNVARHVDFLIGVVPIVNLEWIQKLIRDTSERGHSREAVTDSIVRSMDDYINFITPQFSRTHINFQRVPTVDTSNPFSAKVIPSLDEYAGDQVSGHQTGGLPLPAVDDRRRLHVQDEYHRRAGWQDGLRNGTDPAPPDPATDRNGQDHLSQGA